MQCPNRSILEELKRKGCGENKSKQNKTKKRNEAGVSFSEFRIIDMCIPRTIWYHCSNSLLSGLKVRITANGKGWYTWLLEFPTLKNLKNRMAVFMTGLFRFATVFTYRLAQLSNVDNFQKRKRQQHWILMFSFPKRYNQPMHRV